MDKNANSSGRTRAVIPQELLLSRLAQSEQMREFFSDVAAKPRIGQARRRQGAKPRVPNRRTDEGEGKMNNRRKLLVAPGAATLAVRSCAYAQQSGKIRRVGFLSPRHVDFVDSKAPSGFG